MLTTKWILKRLNFPGDIILLGQEEYTIGRGKDNYQSVLSIFVSRKHCLFRVIEGNLVVKDLNSSNGTFINESKIPPNKDIILRDHDCIGIGVPSAGGSDHYVYSLLKEGDFCNKIANDDARILKPDLAKEQNKPLNSKALESEDDEENDVLLIENKAFDIIDLSDDEEKEKGRVGAVGSSSAAPSKHPSRNTSCVLGDADASSSAAVQKTRAANPCSKDKCSSNFDSTETSDSVFKRTSKQSENIEQRRENRVYLSNRSDATVNRNYYVCKVKIEPKQQSFSEVEKSHCEKRGLNVSSKICQNVVKIEKPSGVEMGGSCGGSLQANPTLNNAITARLSSNVSKNTDSNSRCGVPSSAKTIRCSSTGFPVDLETTISVVADKDIQIKQEKSSFDSETTESGVCVHNKSSESTLLHGEAKKSSKLNPIRPGTELLNIDVRSDQPTSKVKIEKPSPDAKVDGGNIRKSIHQNLTSSDSSKVASNSNIPAEITVKKEKAIDDTCADSVRKNLCENTEEIVGRQSQTQPKHVSSLFTSTKEKSSEAEVMKKSRSSKLVQNVSESVKQKNSEREIEVPVLSERTEKHKQNLKRPHEISTLVSPRTNLNDSSDPVSKRTKFGPVISRNLSNSSSRSSSPCSSHTECSNSSSTSLSSEDVDNNPDKWFAKVSVPFLDQLEKTISLKTDGSNSSCHSKRKTTENFVANAAELKMKKTKSKLKSKKTYYIKDVDPLPRFLDPIVVVEKLNLKKVNENSMSRSSSCDSLFEEAMQVLESVRNLNDTSPLSNTPSQSTSLNYSQIDDVVVIDDDTDEDDEMKDISTNKADKNSNNDEFKDDGEEVVVKQEIFDDDYEDQIDNDDGDDDDDEVQLVNEWVCKLSQSSQLLEDEVILSGREENKRLSSVSSDSSDEEIPKSTEQEQPNIGDKTNDRMNIISLSDGTSDETDEEIFDLKGRKSKKNETSHGKHFASSIDKDGSVPKNEKTDKYKSYFPFSSDKGEIDDAIFKLPGNIDVEFSSDDEIFPSKTTKTKNDKVFASEKNITSYNDSDECELRNKTKTSYLVEDKNVGESYRHSSFSTKISEENAQDISKHSAYNDNEIYSRQKSSLHQKKDVQKASVKEPFGTEVTLEEYAEKLLDSAFTAQKDKTDGKSDDKRNKSVGSSTNERSDNTKKHSTSSNQPSNRRTLMCSALPIAPRSRSKTVTEKADRHKTLTADSVKAKSNKNEMSHRTTTTHVKSRSRDYKSKSPEMKINDNYHSEREKLDKVREERKAKLKALTAQKAEATTSKADSRVPVKPSYRAKNTTSSRADKLTESIVSSKTSGGSKNEKIKVRVVQKKSDADKSSANHLPHSSNKMAPQTDNIEKQLPATKITGVVPNEASCDPHLEDTSVPEIEKQIKNLSLKNDYRIPKLKFTTSLPAETRTSISGSVKENKITKKPSKAPPKRIPLRPAIRNVMTSYPKKTVHFAPAESLCRVQSFHIEDGNSLHRIEGKDAPVRKALAHQAEALYDSSQNVLNRVISAILKTWNPRWFQEEKIVAQKGGEPPPAHCESTPVSSLCPMLTAFTSYQEYLKIVHPLMLLDLWARISEDANKPNQRAKEKYEISVGEKKDVNGLLVLSCAMPISVRQDREGLYPHVGDLCTLRCPIWDPEQDNVHNTQRPHQEKHLERFAYIESMTRDFRSVNDSTWRQGNLKKFTGPVHAVLHFVIKLKGDKRLNFINLSLKVISCIRSELRMFEAVGYLERTRLCKMILSPCVSDYRLPRANAEMQLTSRDILNVSQRTAVFQCSSICLHSAPKLCLVQGPPGTGKTKVIINIIQQILYPNGQYSKQRWDKKTRILLCAPSNAAADEMAERLLAIRAEMQKDRFKMVRIGPLESMRESVRGVSLDGLAKKEVEASMAHQMSLESVEVEIATLEARRRSYVMACEHASSKKENTAMYEKRIQEVERRLAQLKCPMRNVPSHKASELEREARKKLLSYADIIVSTLSSSFNPQMTEVFASRNGRSIARFSCCIIDEATQSKEPECLIPLMYGIEKIVLVGDPEQLPATVISQVAKEKSFGQSLFNRIWNKFQNEAYNPVIFLNTQYRMHPDIYHWPNTYIYHGKVISDYNFHSIFKPYCLFAHKYQQHSTSFVNSNEAILVSDVAKAVANRFSNCVKTIGIITPYQRQLQEIRNHIDGSRPHPVTIVVNTIDGFQGRECDIIIFSCVRTRGVGFMCESQRLNVALTRARHSLIICGNFVSLQGDRMWASLLGDAMQRRVVVDTHNVIFSQADIVNQLLKPT